MNLREQKNDLTQPLLQEFKVDILESALREQPAQRDKKMNNALGCSTVQLDEVIKKIDSCILILNELGSNETLKLENTKNRKRSRYQGLFIGIVTILIENAGILVAIIMMKDTSMRTGFGTLLALINIFNFCTTYQCIRQIKLKNIQSFAAIADNIDENEKNHIFDLARELEINPYEYTLIDFINLMEKKKIDLIYQKNSGPCKTAFLMGSVLVYGAKSSVRTFFNNHLFDKKVCGLVFQFADFLEIPKKEKAERVTTELKDIMFFTQAFDHERDERVLQEILSFMGLSDSELNAERMLGPGLSKM